MAFVEIKGFDPYIGSSWISRRPYNSFENQSIRDSSSLSLSNFTYSILFSWNINSSLDLGDMVLNPFSLYPGVGTTGATLIYWSTGPSTLGIYSGLGPSLTEIAPFPFNQLCNLTISSTPSGRYVYLNGTQINSTIAAVSPYNNSPLLFFIDQTGGVPTVSNNDKIVINGVLPRPVGTPVAELPAISTVDYLQEQLTGQVAQKRKSIFSKIFNNETPVNPPVSVPLVGQEVRTDQYRFYYPRPNHMSFKLRGGING